MLAISICQQIHGMLKDEATASRDYQVLELWSKVNTCLGDRPAMLLAAARLRQIGYLDRAYLQSLPPTVKE